LFNYLRIVYSAEEILKTGIKFCSLGILEEKEKKIFFKPKQ